MSSGHRCASKTSTNNLSSFELWVNSFPPGWQFPHLHPRDFGSLAASMLSHLHHSRNPLLVAFQLSS
ncbi:hypothetical protein AMECASPLE_018636 [Ameca splendens]|uniref:Uncharacterized protein n=1 Tax=Ameca splendens TaxID=208324 RepID=A0ABV0YE09_9TELE